MPVNNKVDKKIFLAFPAVIAVAIVTQIPIILTLYDSFFQKILVRPDLPHKFMGFYYYKDLLVSSNFWIVFKNTVVLTFVSLVSSYALGLLFAILLYRRFPGVGIARTLLISPFFIMDSVIGVFWRNVMLQPSYGLIHYLCDFIGLKTPSLLAEYPLLVITFLVIWKWTPFFMLVLIAGLQSLSQDIIDASLVDGTNNWQRFYRITFPSLQKYTSISLILGFVFIMKTFGLIFTTTKGGPGFASTNFPFFVYRTTFLGWNVGRGAAIAVILVIISLSMIMILFKVLRKSVMEHEL